MTAILWGLYEVLINYYQGFILSYFIFNFLTPKVKKQAKIGGVICTIAYGTVVTVLNYITVFEGIGVALYIIVLGLYAFICFKNNVIKKCFASILPFLILVLITTSELSFASSICDTSVEGVIVNQNIVRFATLIIIQVSFLATVLFILKAYQFASERYRFIDWVAIIATLILSVILVIVLHFLSLNISSNLRIYISIAYAFIIAINVMILVTIYLLFQKNNKLSEMEIIKLQQQYQQQYIDSMTVQYNSIRKIKHDINNQLSTVYTLVSENRTDDAMRLIEQSSDAIKSIPNVVSTNNSVVNAIVNAKLSIASTFGIKTSCLSTNDFEGIADLDLCNLLSNMLDNAINATISITHNNKMLYLEISRERNVYTFSTKNSIDASVISPNPKLQTSNKDKQNHGYGTEIIKDIARKYNGRFDFYEQDSLFCVNVTIKI